MVCNHDLGYTIKPPNFSKAASHELTEKKAFAHIHKWQDVNSAAYYRGGETSKCTQSGWCDFALRGRSQRCSENVRKRHEVEEKPLRKRTQTEREKERFGRSKIIVTLSLDSTHYFSIQWAQCRGDMAEIQLQSKFDSGSRDEAVDLQCHTVSV